MSNHHKNVNFKVLDTANLSNDLSGILGQFLTPGAYSVRKSGFDSNEGFLLFNGKVAEVKYKRHAWNKNCWTLSDADFLEMTQL
jgi:hypothetical protein